MTGDAVMFVVEVATAPAPDSLGRHQREHIQMPMNNTAGGVRVGVAFVSPCWRNALDFLITNGFTGRQARLHARTDWPQRGTERAAMAVGVAYFLSPIMLPTIPTLH